MCDKNVDPSSFEDNQMKLTKWPGALTVRSRLAEVGRESKCYISVACFHNMVAVIYLDLASLKFL